MLYNLFYVISFILALLYIIFFAKKFALTKAKGILLITFCYATLFMIMLLLYYLINGTFGGRNMIHIYIFLPFVVAFFAKALDIKLGTALDYFSPVPIIVFAGQHFGCVFPGCCYSNIEVSWGIANRYTSTTLFPNQILEAVIATLTVVFLIWILRRNNYNMGGKAMGYMLMIYGTQRFLLEFIRDNEKLFWGISDLAIWAAVAVVFGIILNILIKKRSRRNEKIF